MKTKIILIAGLFTTTPVAFAHDGQRIFLGNSGGRITTYIGDNNESSTLFSSERIFSTELPNFLGSGIYTTDFPGYQIVEGTGVVSNTDFSFNLLGPLLYFDNYNPVNGTGIFKPVSTAFSSLSGIPQMALSESSSVRVTSGLPQTGFSFLTYTGAGDHGHISYTLFGNGTGVSNGPAGMYALPLEITSPSLSTSLPFYLLLGKDVAPGTPQFIASESIAHTTLVPEPGALSVLALMMLSITRRRRKIE